MDTALRNALWDALSVSALEPPSYGFLYKSAADPHYMLAYNLWNGYFHQPIDTIPEHWSNLLHTIRTYFFSCDWYDAYNILEFIGTWGPSGEKLRSIANTYMAREMAAYRFVDKQIVQITDTSEIREIETAIEVSPKPVAHHLATALAYLSDRTTPDYRNSVKESISAVEAAAKQLTGLENATLSDAVKKLPPPPLHPAFSSALSKLYGYTSDASGIRHALSDESTIDQAEANSCL